MRQQQNSVLPFDIIETVLSRLPVKSLLRFKTVSKSWKKMISSPVFARIHLNQSKYSNSQKLFLRMSSFEKYDTDELFYLIKFEDQKNKLQTLKLMNGPDEDWDKILCFCDGVILLTNYGYRNFVLWNPSTGTHTSFYSQYGFSNSRYGLCHDPEIGFKVVILDKDYYYVFSANYRFRMKAKEYEEDHNGRKMNGSEVNMRSGVCVDGVVYFYTRYNNGLDIRSKRLNDSDIIYFDPRDDKMKILQKPVIEEGNKWFYLDSLGGCLCMYRRGKDETKMELWIKEKGRGNNSWNLLITVERTSRWSIFDDFDPLCFVENNKILVQLGISTLVLYNCCGNKFEEIDLEDEFGRYGRVSYRDNILVPYIDSLFYPGKKMGGKKKRRYGKKSGGKSKRK